MVEREVFNFLNMYMKFFYSYLFFLLMKNQELSFFFYLTRTTTRVIGRWSTENASDVAYL